MTDVDLSLNLNGQLRNDKVSHPEVMGTWQLYKDTLSMDNIIKQVRESIKQQRKVELS